MKRIFILITMVLICHSIFCNEYQNSVRVAYNNTNLFDSYTFMAKGLIGSGIAMMSVSVLPINGMAFCCILGYGLEILHTPLLGFMQLGGAGAMMMYYGIRKYFDYITKDTITGSKIMRNIGIITLTTSTIPIAVAAIFGTWIFSTLSYQDIMNPYNYDLKLFIIDVILAFSQLACGIGFLSAGLYCYHWNKKFTPEISMVHYEKRNYDEGYKVHLGMRVRL